MKSKQIELLNEGLIEILKETTKRIKIYEELYQQLNTNKSEEYQQLKELLQKNEDVLIYEEQINEMIAQTLPKYMECFWDIKQQQNDIKNKINSSVDKLMRTSKITLKQSQETLYYQQKEELQKKYIQTDEMKQRQKEKKEKQKRKVFSKQFEIKWNEMMKESIERNKEIENMKDIKEIEKNEREMSNYYGSIKILHCGESNCGSKSSFIKNSFIMNLKNIDLIIK